MNLDGKRLDGYVRFIRTAMDTLDRSLPEALGHIPENYRDAARRRWEEESVQEVRLPAATLSASGGPRPWSTQWDSAEGFYWRRLRNYLLDTVGRSETAITVLDDESDRVLRQLEDPRQAGPSHFEVKGLVVGYVQSGKTANFSALIAKSADLGYKLVIVLSGIHNSLRLQTQQRLALELGLDPKQGVGIPEPGRRWLSMTSSDLRGDFNPGSFSAAVLQGNERVVAVVKKNKTVLERLIFWMSGKVPSSLPVLIIDDEADQASINTGGNRPPLAEMADLLPEDVEVPDDPDEVNPSVINGLIRDLLRCFARVSYVAYTATPFANVLIDHEAQDREHGDDLYPKDFILSLRRPTGYVGAERLFGRDALPGEVEGIDALDVIEEVPEHEADLLTPKARGPAVVDILIPHSLQMAFVDFLLGFAARAVRHRKDEPAAMLVHTQHLTVLQNRLGDALKEHVAVVRRQWKYDREAIVPVLSQRWESNFRPVIRSMDSSRDMEFELLVDSLNALFREPLEVRVLNSTSDDVLDYTTEPNLKAVFVGGNRLSRGLTLEGLLVSYYLRTTDYYDTLLQMGRWFGYRESYVDLTRLWTTRLLATKFRALALAEEDMRRQIRRYEVEKLTPLQFSVRIRVSPLMRITAKNKMGAAETVEQDYACELQQTVNFRLSDARWLKGNIEATREFAGHIGPPSEASDGVYTWDDVRVAEILQFLSAYKAEATGSFDLHTIREYVGAKSRAGELTRWWVSIRGAKDASNGEIDLGIPSLARVGTITRTKLKDSLSSIGSLINPATRSKPGDEMVGLDAGQIAAATAASGDETFGYKLRSTRDPKEGLLLIYPISKSSTPSEAYLKSRVPLFDSNQEPVEVIGIAVVFPPSNRTDTVTYVANRVEDQ